MQPVICDRHDDNNSNSKHVDHEQLLDRTDSTITSKRTFQNINTRKMTFPYTIP